MAAPPTDGAEAQAWVFEQPSSPQTLRSVSLAGLALQPGEALVALTTACVCGSDLHTASGKRHDPAAPLVLGHEGIGLVLQSARADAPVGALVTWGVAAARCGGGCAPCAAYGLPQKCARVLKYGHASWAAPARPAEGLSGCFASHILLREGSEVVVLAPAAAAAAHPAELPPRAALASANCAGATAVAVWRAAVAALGARGGSGGGGGGAAPRVLVWGAGLLGLLCAAEAAVRGGAGVVCVVDVSPARLALALALGATHVALVPAGSSAEEAARAVRAALPPGGAEFDAALEVCGVPEVLAPALALLRPGGALVLAGMVHPASALGSLTGEAIIRKCATICGVHNYDGSDLRGAVALLRALHARGAPWDALFSPPLPLAQLPEAFALAASGAWARVVVEVRAE